MPVWILKLLPLIKTAPWGRVLFAASWLLKFAKGRVDTNLTKKQQQDLIRLLTKSKGKPGKLTQRERTRVRQLVYKAAVGNFPA